MDVSIGEVIIIAVAFAFVAHVYFSHQERRRRLEILHQERLAAIEKGFRFPNCRSSRRRWTLLKMRTFHSFQASRS